MQCNVDSLTIFPRQFMNYRFILVYTYIFFSTVPRQSLKCFMTLFAFTARGPAQVTGNESDVQMESSQLCRWIGHVLPTPHALTTAHLLVTERQQQREGIKQRPFFMDKVDCLIRKKQSWNPSIRERAVVLMSGWFPVAAIFVAAFIRLLNKLKRFGKLIALRKLVSGIQWLLWIANPNGIILFCVYLNERVVKVFLFRFW